MIHLVAAVMTGMLFMVASVPLIQGRIPRNRLYGFRVPKTMSSDAIWYAANAYSGKMFFLAGAVTTLAAIACSPILLFGSTGAGIYSGAWVLIMLAALAVCLYRSFRYLGRL
ncbi:MAG: SdpI family protein [Armatimonadetes bacterium]|nr:SdpI family protein [Armatimonadota bacterium]MDE2206509.1 SdpI family protein [Armatimonadota bacterium]